MFGKDFTRAEGVYPQWIRYVGVDLLQIERVNGNCTVDNVTLTKDEVKKLLDVINEGPKT